MGYASRLGKARISSRNPQAAGVCDRCGAVYQHNTLRSQPFYAGATLVTKNILVCSRCWDVPNETTRSAVLPADPMPIINPRVQDYRVAESNTRQVSGFNTTDQRTGIPVPGGAERATQNGGLRSTQQTGEPPGGLNQQPGTDPNAPGNSTPGLPYDNIFVPQTGPLK